MAAWSERAEWWFEEAIWDFEAAKDLLQTKRYNYVCFHAQQAAEKLLKALLLVFGENAWGKSVRDLLERLGEIMPFDRDHLLAVARELDRHYITSRYPDALPSGPPKRAYDKETAERSLSLANDILEVGRQKRQELLEEENHGKDSG